MTTPTDQFRAARDFLLAHRTDYETAYAKFTWPRPATFNFAVDWFDAVLAAEHPDRVAPTTRCCSTSPPAPPRCPSWWSTRTSATRWGTGRRCTGSACSQETCTSTCPARGGPSTLIQENLAAWRDQLSLRELVGAGEPLNPEVIEVVRRELGVTIRDGFGQTETSLQIGNSPGQLVKAGSMGRPMPGFSITLVDPATGEVASAPGREGEICVDCEPERPVGLMVGYHGDDERNAAAFAGGRYHTGDVASRDEDFR
jgi:acyl-CoA synthetase (AMP-forming)/AMP-acid ligase II